MRLSVCVDAVFNGWEFIEAMEAVKKAGLNAYEFWAWWNKDISAIIKAKEQLELETAAFCTKFVSLVDPSKRQEYKKGLEETLEVAKLLECKTIITQVGNEIPGVPREDQRLSLEQGLKECVPMLEKAGITLVIEPLNTAVNHKGYYLWLSDEAFSIVDTVGSDNVKVLYDIYHQQIMEGNLISRITANISKIGHFHAAGNPGRHELPNGEINYPQVFESIQKESYAGYVGLEYFPLEDPIKGLQQLRWASIIPGNKKR